MIMAGPPGQWPFGPGVNPVVAPGGWLSGVSNPAGISGAGQQNVPSGTGAAGLAAGSNGNAIGVASGFPSGSDLTRSSNGGPDSSGTAPPPVATKVRKPYTITKVRERWTEEEHERFLAALKLYGRAWRKIEAYIGTKSAVQIRSHAQKFFSKLQRESERANAAGGDGSDSGVTVIPPARPKRKPAHPYPRKAPDPATSASGAATAANGNASAFDNAASNVAANLASLGAPGNAAAANFAAALASFAGTSAWGHAGNATAGNPLAGNPFAAAFHPGNPFNPYAVNTVANPLAAMQAAISQAAAVNGGAQAAAQAQAQAQATQHLRATLAARRRATSGARARHAAVDERPTSRRRRPRRKRTRDERSIQRDARGCGGGGWERRLRTVAKRGRGRRRAKRRVGIHGLDGRIGGATSRVAARHRGSWRGGAAHRRSVGVGDDVVRVRGRGGGFSLRDSSGWDSSGDSSKGGGSGTGGDARPARGALGEREGQSRGDGPGAEGRRRRRGKRRRRLGRLGRIRRRGFRRVRKRRARQRQLGPDQGDSKVGPSAEAIFARV